MDGEGEERLTSAVLPRASWRTSLSRPVARSFTRSTEEALAAIQAGSVRGGKRRIAPAEEDGPEVADEELAVAVTEGAAEILEGTLWDWQRTRGIF